MAEASPAPLFRSYADPGVLTDEIIRLYLAPLLSSQQRIAAFERYWLSFDNAQTVAIHQGLRRLKVPTLIVWGLADIFFDVKWAYWLKDTIPGAERVIEVADGRLFFAEDRPKSLSEPLLGFGTRSATSSPAVSGRAGVPALSAMPHAGNGVPGSSRRHRP